MSSSTLRWFALLLLVPVFLVGCSGGETLDPPFRKETAAVTGVITVDGEPPSGPVVIKCYPVAGIDKEHPSSSSSRTGDLGAFEISTYEKGDGIPEGDYVLTFTWQKFNTFSMNFSGPDKLNGRYKDPRKSEIKVSVKGAEPIDLGTIELTTK